MQKRHHFSTIKRIRTVTLIVAMAIVFHTINWSALASNQTRPSDGPIIISDDWLIKEEAKARAKRRRAKQKSKTRLPLNAPPARPRNKAMSQPNFLFIAVDDLKKVLGIMSEEPGNFLSWVYPDPQVRQQVRQILTPNMDQLASEGFLFMKAYCPYPVCNASRSAILTGMRPRVTGHIANSVHFRDDPEAANATTLPQNLKNQGYYTAGVGKIYHHAQVALDSNDNIITDWPDSQLSWDVWVNRSIGSSGQKTFSPYTITGINFGSSSETITNQDDYLNADFIADVLENGTATTTDSEYGTQVTVTLPQNQPFFLGLGLFLPHRPFIAPEELLNQFDVNDIQIDQASIQAIRDDLDDLATSSLEIIQVDSNGDPIGPFQQFLDNGVTVSGAGGDVLAWKELVRHYLASVAMADRAVGRVLDGLENSAYKDNTIVVLWSDHGYDLGEKYRADKSDLWEEATATVLLIKDPNRPNGYTVRQPVNLMSLYPTISNMAGVTIPNYVEEDDLTPLLDHPSLVWSSPSRSVQGSTVNRHVIHTADYTYIRYKEDLTDAELYDINNDPDELVNLLNNPSYQQIKTDLDNLLELELASPSAQPVATIPADQVNETDDTISLTINAADPDGNNVTFSATGLPPNLTMNTNSGEISGMAGTVGIYTPTITVSDGRDATMFSFGWTVNEPSNQPPTITSPGNQSGTVADTVSLTINANDNDEDPLAFAAQGLPPGTIINTATGHISGTLTVAGTFTPTVSVDDGRGGNDSTSFGWFVNGPPQVTNPGNQSNTVGDTINLTIQVTDPNNDAMTFSISGLPTGLQPNPPSGPITGQIQIAGQVTTVEGSSVSVNVTDSRGAVGSITFFWQVQAAPNQEPTISNPGNQSHTVGNDVNLNISASDPDNDPLTFSVSGLPPGLAPNSGTGQITGQPTQGGTYTVTVTVSDGRGGSDLTVFSWHVNALPTVNSPGNQNSTVGDNANLTITANDPDGGTITYQASGLPSGTSIDPASGQITGMINMTGTFTVNIVVFDGQGGNASTSFNWVVTDPVISCGGLSQEAENGTVSGNMVIGSDPAASGSAFVESMATASKIDGDENLDQVVFCVDVPTSGDYVLKATFKADDYLSNSFLITIADAPAGGFLWDAFPVGQGYVNDYVSHRDGADPVVLSLTQGQHTLVFSRRETGIKLDKFELVPFSQYTPPSAEEQAQHQLELGQNLAAEGDSAYELALPFIFK